MEYMILITIIMGALLAAGNYFKRGLQGRWKSVADDLGDQYDPRTANSAVRHTLLSNSITEITAIEDSSGGTNRIYTQRHDIVNTVEMKTGFEGVGAY